MYMNKVALVKEWDSDFEHVWYANRRQQVLKSVTIMLNPKTLDNKERGI